MTFYNDINVGILMTPFCVFVFVLFFTGSVLASFCVNVHA